MDDLMIPRDLIVDNACCTSSLNRSIKYMSHSMEIVTRSIPPCEIRTDCSDQGGIPKMLDHSGRDVVRLTCNETTSEVALTIVLEDHKYDFRSCNIQCA